MQSVVGAVAAPILVAGLVTAVPPEISDVAPPTLVPSSTQVVTKVRTVLEVAVAVTRMYSGVYGAVALLSWNMVVGLVVKLYQPVVVVKAVCVPPVPPIRVVPVYAVPAMV